jgi:acetyl/propionyl-CoA carboxylase alpha subunit
VVRVDICSVVTIQVLLLTALILHLLVSSGGRGSDNLFDMKQHHSPSPEHVSTTSMRAPLFVAQLRTNISARRRIRTVLIANRGEIACRIIRTCRRLGLRSVAIYAEEDTTSLHIEEADEAVSLGGINQADGNPFLNISVIVNIAQAKGVDAIHPGYGYLSENNVFADAVRQAGMIFIGPSSQAMSTLGDKRNSKEYLRQHAPSVPLIPGFSGSSQDVTELEAAAEKVGYPIMLKASAGGGGRGMRIVHERSQLAAELARAQSEAKRSFGSSDCILEKYVQQAKHVEVQIMGDSHGKVISLWERECSVQRRHQKIIEETPSPFLDPEQRKRMCAAAVQIGELIGYEGAGTVEFVVDVRDGSFYFLEVNTRLQVEHPITEEVTGLDVVSLQLFVAAGGSLASLPYLRQIPQHGHAIECRLCAEDPSGDFMPQSGTIRLWHEASQFAGDDVRYETAVQTESSISIYFDSMIAKIIVWAPTREVAISKMVKVLANTVCAGIRTNQQFLQACLMHPGFHDPEYTTSFIPIHLNRLLQNPHTDAAEQMVSMLSIIPGLLLRDALAERGSSKPFRHVRSDFRNQYFDPVNVSTTIVMPETSFSKPVLSLWKSDRNSEGHTTYNVSLVPIPDTGNAGASKAPVATQISYHYHSISHMLRNGSVASAPKYNVQLLGSKSLQGGRFEKPQGRPAAWTRLAVILKINDSTIHAVAVTDALSSSRAVSMGSAATFSVHLPSLGSSITYKAYSGLLAYMESLRPAFEANSSSSVEGKAGSKSVKAPMPCKVLSMLKEDGADVRTGEVVMVIESMKMETNISVPSAGKFRTERKAGEGVGDGGLLCWLE